MKKYLSLLIVAAAAVTSANAGVSFSISIGDHHRHHPPVVVAPAPPRVVVVEPRHGPVYAHGHGPVMDRCNHGYHRGHAHARACGFFAAPPRRWDRHDDRFDRHDPRDRHFADSYRRR